ncbi:MAG: hypothetical protein KatS3mg105_4316 [Gemmatales bacterium]|nr:MAG: hypothetical protein KatS3mg105_4316 [Gemmatales bacterium]
MKWIGSVLLTAVLLIMPGEKVWACPLCSDSISEAASDNRQDPYRQARAYAASIYLMGGMPYLLLATFGFIFWRSVKKAQREADNGANTISD